MTDVLMVTYYFDKSDGVGAFRSIYLSKYLKSHNINVSVLSKINFGENAAKNRAVWAFKLFLSLLNRPEKLIYVSCGPFWHVLIVWLACRITRKKYICDFRDPWSLDMESGYGGTNKKAGFMKLFVARSIERLLYKNCKYFWVCTEGMFNRYSILFCGSEKLMLVPNGYEITANDIAPSFPTNNDDEIIFVCIGRLAVHGNTTTDSIFARLKEFDTSLGKKSVRIKLIGTEENIIRDIVERNGLLKNTEFYDRMSHSSALAIAASSDTGICLVRDEDLMYGTKAFDYIGLGMPILDIFDHRKNFYKYFRDYLVSFDGIEKAEKYQPPFEMSREYSFEKALYAFIE